VIYVARVGEVSCAYKCMSWKIAIKKHSVDVNVDGKDISSSCLLKRKIGCYDVDWIHLVCGLL
jgi:hypothetical protein